jgi:hypothetical protein
MIFNYCVSPSLDKQIVEEKDELDLIALDDLRIEEERSVGNPVEKLIASLKYLLTPRYRLSLI